MIDIARERDIERLRQVATLQQRELELLHHKLARLSLEVDRLSGRAPGTLELSLKDIEQRLDAPEAPQRGKSERRGRPDKTEASQPQTGHGPTPQAQLEVIETIEHLDQPDRACPQCGGELKTWEGQFEQSEVVDLVERRFVIRRVKRQKYVCRCGGCVETAPPIPKVVPGGRYSLDFAVSVALGKYLDHLPLERQVRQMSRLGLATESQTLWDQVWHLSQLLVPSYDALLTHILSQPVIGMDQTGWPRLSEGGGKPWQMWCLSARDAIYHRIQATKSRDATLQILGDYTGTVVCDAMSSHGAAARAGPGFVLAGCWAHARRKFFECEPSFPEATKALDWIAALYAIERRATDEADRLRLRQAESKAVLAELWAWLHALPVLPGSGLGRAAKYLWAQWPMLTRFVDNAAIWIDNNLTERSLRGPVVGRKNHYGSKTERGTKVAAIFYSLIETAKLVGVDPAAYLRTAALSGLQSPGAVLLPSQLQSRLDA